jgi:hypothetical protein
MCTANRSANKTTTADIVDTILIPPPKINKKNLPHAEHPLKNVKVRQSTAEKSLYLPPQTKFL